VCESCADPKTMQRELNALKEAMIELHLNTGIIVTKTEENIITLEALTIFIIPAWKFLLTTDIQKNN
jgi:predicted AAA+ superfamily ATPase